MGKKRSISIKRLLNLRYVRDRLLASLPPTFLPSNPTASTTSLPLSPTNLPDLPSNPTASTTSLPLSPTNLPDLPSNPTASTTSIPLSPTNLPDLPSNLTASTTSLPLSPTNLPDLPSNLTASTTSLPLSPTNLPDLPSSPLQCSTSYISSPLPSTSGVQRSQDVYSSDDDLPLPTKIPQHSTPNASKIMSDKTLEKKLLQTTLEDSQLCKSEDKASIEDLSDFATMSPISKPL
ncbi:UNVERIFIED_CONTAM: hypothetical protein RMT77_013633 [Armadillidium vulgare]